MDYTELKKARDEYKMMSDIYDILESKGIVKSPIVSVPLRDILRQDIARYLQYLSASDGQIDDNELMVYRVITGFSDDAQKILKDIENNSMSASEFLSTVPPSLKIAVDAELIMMRMSGQKIDETLPVLLVDLYSSIGFTLIQADGGVTDSEERDFKIYLNTLKEYVSERAI